MNCVIAGRDAARLGRARPGMARRGEAWLGRAGPGMARQDKDQPSGQVILSGRHPKQN
jgi:hypothetical protein